MERKNPQRMCLGCRKMMDKRQLIRIVKTKENEIHFDHTGKMNGRGAYICRQQSCLEQAVKRKQLDRAFQMRISPEVYTTLEEYGAKVFIVSGIGNESGQGDDRQ